MDERIPKPYQEGERVMILNPALPNDKVWRGFVVEDKPPRRLLVDVDGKRFWVSRQHVRRDL